MLSDIIMIHCKTIAQNCAAYCAHSSAFMRCNCKE